MLSIVIFTFSPEKREEVIKRRSEEDTYERMRQISEWYSAETGRAFRLIEGGDLKATLEAFRTWGGLGKIEVVPVIKSEELIDFFSVS